MNDILIENGALIPLVFRGIVYGCVQFAWVRRDCKRLGFGDVECRRLVSRRYVIGCDH